MSHYLTLHTLSPLRNFTSSSIPWRVEFLQPTNELLSSFDLLSLPNSHSQTTVS